jgi:hypothetical protein
MPDILRGATKHHIDPGQVFNRPTPTTPEGKRARDVARGHLLRALVEDGKTIPTESQDTLALANLFTPAHVQQAIGELNGNTVTEDGIPAEWFRIMAPPMFEDESRTTPMPSPFAKLLAQAFTNMVETGKGMSDRMKRSTIGFIYKEKGPRYHLGNYRPIGITSVLYRILSKVMVIAIQPLLTPVITDLQAAFKEGRYIGESIQLAQDIMSYLKADNQDGFMLFCDQDNAYPRVQWDFLQQVMETMGVHPDYRKAAACMYTHDLEVKVKVNGHLGRPFSPRNGLVQGCPWAPIAYLMYFQTFISLLNKPGPLPRVTGVMIPGQGGDNHNRIEIIAAAFADDLICFLRNEDELPPFKVLLSVYETGAGARNSWPKTFGLREGSLINSEHLPEGWEEGVHINTQEACIRYLGVFLGTPERVAAKWHLKTTAKIKAKFSKWRASSMPRSIRGRNLVIKNSAMALAWFLVQHQVPPDLDHMMDEWYKLSWDFFESGAHVKVSLTSSPPTRQTGRARVERRVLVQDYDEGGQRCLDIEAFTRALYAKQVSRLLHPEPHPGKNLVHYFVNLSYGALRMGHRLYLSNCDFLALAEPVPLFWRTCLKVYGSFQGPSTPSA